MIIYNKGQIVGHHEVMVEETLLTEQLLDQVVSAQRLVIRRCSVTPGLDVLEKVSEMPYLQHLEIQGTPLETGIPLDMGNISNLRVLTLSACGLDGPIPSELGDLTNLQMLDLSNNRLHGKIPRSFGKLPRLQRVNLACNRMQSDIPPSLAGREVEIDLSYNDLFREVERKEYEEFLRVGAEARRNSVERARAIRPT